MSRLVNETRFGQATALNPALKSDQTGAARQKSTRKKESSYQNLPSLQFTEFTVLFPFLFHDFLIYFELQYLEFPLVAASWQFRWFFCGKHVCHLAQPGIHTNPLISPPWWIRGLAKKVVIVGRWKTVGPQMNSSRLPMDPHRSHRSSCQSLPIVTICSH